MKFKIIILMIIFVSILALTGCQKKGLNSKQIITNTKESKQSTSSSKNNTNSIDNNFFKEYNGTWFSSDYKEVKNNGDMVFIGTKMIIQIGDQHNKIMLLNASSLPSNRIASIETSWKKINEDQGEFTFQDDSWGNKGTGTIIFKNNQIIVNIIYDKAPTSMWYMFVGKKIFKKVK